MRGSGVLFRGRLIHRKCKDLVKMRGVCAFQKAVKGVE